jgi:hypothetical protein
MVPKKGFGPPSFGNSFSLNEIAASIEYTRLSDFATKSIHSTLSSDSMKFVNLWTPCPPNCCLQTATNGSGNRVDPKSQQDLSAVVLTAVS